MYNDPFFRLNSICILLILLISIAYGCADQYDASTNAIQNNEYCLHLYTRDPIVARRAWPTGRVRRASKGILHTIFI